MPGSSDETVFVVGMESGTYALRLAHVREIMRPLSSEPVAGAPVFVLGIARVRGEAVPVLDLARFVSNAGASTRPAGRWVRMAVRDRSFVLAVDAVRGVRTLSAEIVGTLPPLLAGAEHGAVEQVALLDGEIVRILGEALRVPDEVWSVMEAHA